MEEKTLTPEKLDLESLDIVDDNKSKLKQLFPSVFTETVDDKGNIIESIDFEMLKTELGKFSDIFESRKERYGMDWPGKRDCMKLIQQPSRATLKPCREESVDFDMTENLFIEGENLEVLKLLQKSYYGKIKMIYIDPPYNTGKEFIYPDNFKDSLGNYLELTGQIDNEGRQLSANPESAGRYHTNWLNMIYPRLYLARNLLKEEGVIFISIGDDEIANLKKICDDIFGEKNCSGIFIWEKKKKPSFLDQNMGSVTDYIVSYSKDRKKSPLFSSGLVDERKKYPFNNAGNGIQILKFPAVSVKFYLEDQYIPAQDMSEGNIITELIDDVIIKNGTNLNEFRLRGEWRYSQLKVDEFFRQKSEIIISKIPFRPNYIKESGEKKKTSNLLSYRINKIPTNEDATNEIRNLFGCDLMSYPKPSGLIKYLISAITNNDDIIVDFFAGSSTTAHAILNLNKDDGGKRRFIMIQLPEQCDENTEAFKTGYKTISDIGKERIRRVIKKIKEENTGKNTDLFKKEEKEQGLGFKVFKLDHSNFKVWEKPNSDTTEKDLKNQIELYVEHIDERASEEDILYEILLKSGFALTEKIEVIELSGKKVYDINDNSLLICLEDDITKELIDSVAKREPLQFICLDRGFHGNDQLKANAVQTFKALNQTKEKDIQIVFKTV